MDSRKQILMINTFYGIVGGVERFMLQMLKMLKEEGYEVHGIFESEKPGTELFEGLFSSVNIAKDKDISFILEDYKQKGITLAIIHKCDSPKWIEALNALLPTFVIIHDHDYYCPRRHKYFPIKRTNCPLPYNPIYCTICCLGIEKRDGKTRPLAIIKKHKIFKAVKNCTYSMVLSDSMKHNLLKNGWDEKKIIKITPWQELSESTAQEDKDTTNILYVGQLIRGKGVDLLLQGLSTVDRDFSCSIAGRGNDEEYLKSLASELGLDKKVSFIGWQNDPDSLYEKSSFVIFPSRWQEPFGLVGLEAFAHKKAVIAFDTGGVKEWLKHKVNGILVRANDYQSLGKAITKLIDDKALGDRYAMAGYQLVKEKYSYQAFKESLLPHFQKHSHSHYNQSSLIEKDPLKLFDIPIQSIMMEDAIEKLNQVILRQDKTKAFFINADCINKVFKDREYYQILRANRLNFADGIGIKIAAKIIGQDVLDNVNGTDMLPHLCRLSAQKGYKLFLLGAAPSVAESAKEKLEQAYPGVQICGTLHGYFHWDTEAGPIIEEINKKQTDILLVAFGAPLQEKFITRFFEQVQAPVQMGVGGLFDFFSGRIPRAPLWMRKTGTEWVYRLIQEPKRMWKRYILGNPLFIWRILVWKYRKFPPLYR